MAHAIQLRDTRRSLLCGSEERRREDWGEPGKHPRNGRHQGAAPPHFRLHYLQYFPIDNVPKTPHIYVNNILKNIYQGGMVGRMAAA